MRNVSQRLARVRMFPPFYNRIGRERWSDLRLYAEQAGMDFDALPQWLREAVLEAEAQLDNGH
jgi:hypothetical protein